MPSEAVQRSARQPVRAAITTTPPRLRPKAPLGPNFPQQFQAAAGRPKQSAVERLEADKAKYVKSQEALTKQLPVRPPDAQKPPLNSSTALRPTRKTPTPTKPKRDQVQLDLAHLTNLISGVNDGPQPSATKESEDKAPECTTPSGGSPAGARQKKEKPRPPPRTDWSSPAKVRLKASGPARLEGPSAPVSPAAGTVRRVDVIPQTSPMRSPCRAPLNIRQPLHPISLQTQFPLRQAASHLHLLHPRTTTGRSPLKPVVPLQKPDSTPTSPAGNPVPAAPPPALPVFLPSSPARTRLSSSSSRKRPSLTRSKSDMSDRCSRAGTELERFFNLCGLDPAELQEWTGSCSDIVSMARFRSVSAPGSECAGSGREDEDDEDDEGDVGNPTGRVPYGVSVIERNARVIKWLYGIRHAKDNASKSTNL